MEVVSHKGFIKKKNTTNVIVTSFKEKAPLGLEVGGVRFSFLIISWGEVSCREPERGASPRNAPLFNSCVPSGLHWGCV